MRNKYLKLISHFTNPEIQGDRIQCIYFLLKRKRVVYIGKTKDLKARIAGHKGRGVDLFSHFRYIECPPDKQDYYERRWIYRFKPKRNCMWTWNSRNKGKVISSL